MRLFLPTPLTSNHQSATDPAETLAILLERIEQVLERLAKLESAVISTSEPRSPQAWYSPAAAAKALGLAEFTVRNYCRLGRIRGTKRLSGRGRFRAWTISHEELERVRREGLLPLQRQMLL